MNKENKKRQGSFVTGVGVVLFSLAVIILLFLFKKEPEKKERKEKVVTIETITLQAQPYTYHLYSNGVVEAMRETLLSSEVVGTVIETSRNFVDGGTFKKGDILLKVDPIDYETAFQKAISDVAQAQLNLKVEKARAQQAEEDWERLAHDKEPTELALRRPQLKSAEATYKSALARAEQAKRDLEKTIVKAPYDGKVRSTQVDLGSYVTPGMPLASIYGTEALEVKAPFSLKDLQYLGVPLHYDSQKMDMPPPQVVLSARISGELVEWQGALVRTENEIQATTRTLRMVIHVAKENRYSLKSQVPLILGMFVDVRVQGKTVERVYKVPKTAFVASHQVLVLDKESRLHIREVTVLKDEGDYVVLSQGLAEGEQVCVTSLNYYTEGMKVNVAD